MRLPCPLRFPVSGGEFVGWIVLWDEVQDKYNCQVLVPAFFWLKFAVFSGRQSFNQKHSVGAFKWVHFMEAKAETLHLWSASYWRKSWILHVCSVWFLANHEQINYKSPNIECHLLHIRVDSSNYQNPILIHSGSWLVEFWQADEEGACFFWGQWKQPLLFVKILFPIAFLKMIQRSLQVVRTESRIFRYSGSHWMTF